jgi:hypothetical protein
LKEELIQLEQEQERFQREQQPTTTFLELLSATEPSLQPAQPQPEEELDSLEVWRNLIIGGEET